MTTENFDRCLAELLRHEGGYVDHPSDPGGETNMGITRRTYPNEDIRGMSRERASEIYRRDFWRRISGDQLPAGLDLVAFDAAVNSGPSRGAKWLQTALGVKPDGKIGAETLEAARTCDVETAIVSATEARLDFLRGLRTWDTFGVGWSRRVESVRAVALAMAQDNAPADTSALAATLNEALGAIADLQRRMAAVEHPTTKGGRNG